MNLKTTVVLVILALAGGISWLIFSSRHPGAATSETLAILENELKPDRLSRIEVNHNDRKVVLERAQDGEWTLPGKWPTRKQEVDQLIELVTHLRSRFYPIPLGSSPDLASYGLDDPPVVVKVHTGDDEYVLKFGEEVGQGNRFSRPTFLRIGDKSEVVRLAPGLVTSLIKPFGFYQQHRLFPAETVKEGQEKSERLQARALAVEEKKGTPISYSLARNGEEWELQAPVHDRPDSDKLKTILTAIPGIWADKFVENAGNDLTKYGLKDPEVSIRVTRTNGEIMTLLIGKESREEKRTIMRPAPPFGQPRPPQPESIIDKYRFAKIQDNDQVFEVKDDSLKDIIVPLDSLRDARLARFNSNDAQSLEISYQGNAIVLAKEKEHWRLKKPIDSEAETRKVTELLDKLSGLQARDKDVIDKGDPKTYGLDHPAGTIKIKVDESKGDGVTKISKPKTFTFLLGKRDTDKAKVYVRVEGLDRIDAVEDSLLKVVDRPALAYRGRRVLDFLTSDLARIEIQNGDQKFALEQAKGSWRLQAPVQVEADVGKAGRLASDLANLEAVEFVNDSPKADDLDKLYGLAKPGLSATVTFSKADKPAKTLVIGKQRGDKPEYFARLADKDSPAVFAVKKEIHDALEQNSLAYRPTELWNVPAGDITDLRLEKEGHPYRLKHEGNSWKIVEPFEASPLADKIEAIVKDLATLRCERYEAHVAKDLKHYGLDMPYSRLALTAVPRKESREGKEDKEGPEAKEKPKQHVLLIGKPTAAGATSRFAKLGDGEAVFVVDQKVVAALDQGPLELLDRNLLTLDAQAIKRIENSSAAGEKLGLKRDKDDWKVESPAGEFVADREVIAALLGTWSNLRADRFADYGPKVNPATYGLDKPFATMTLALDTKPPAIDAKEKPAKAHLLALGKAVEGKPGERYARLDNGPGVVVLNAATVTDISRTYLDFVDRTLFKFDPAKVTALQRKMGDEDLEVVKRDELWQIIKPVALKADGPTMDSLLDQLAGLRGQRIAAYKTKELAAFGLDKPAAVLTLRLAGEAGKEVQHTLRIGKASDEKSGDRFVMGDDQTKVAVLPGAMARSLLGGVIHFRDRNLVRFADVDRVTMERGPRKAEFAKVEGTWKLVKPLEAEADHTEMEDLINALAKLRADELVADDVKDLKPYGLDRPEVRWRFLAGDKEVLGLALGAYENTKGPGTEKEGKRCYAKLAAGDLVFLLDPRLTGKMLGEYRARTVWSSSLDAAQVEAIRFTYSQNPFVLEKVDNAWKVAGKPDVKVKPETVTETLDALARLKIERYVLDKDADLKLYGLEPPQLVLEVQTPTGKKSLHIGRTEGQSKRYYAHLPEPNRTDVFLISEADAAKIVRTLPGFTEGKSVKLP